MKIIVANVEYINREELKVKCPILYPSDIFENTKEIFNSYILTFKTLIEVDYNIDSFIKALKDDTMLSVIVDEEADFIVEAMYDKKAEKIEQCYSSETKNGLLFAIEYNAKSFNISDKKEKSTFDVTLALFYNNLEMYFSGGSVFILDRANNKKVWIYLD